MEHFNKYFVNVGTNMAAKIPYSKKHFNNYLTKNNFIQEEKTLTYEEFIIKSPVYDDISFHLVKTIFENLYKPPLKHIFQQSLLKGIFPDSLLIASVTPLFKTGEQTSLCNY